MKQSIDLVEFIKRRHLSLFRFVFFYLLTRLYFSFFFTFGFFDYSFHSYYFL